MLAIHVPVELDPDCCVRLERMGAVLYQDWPAFVAAAVWASCVAVVLEDAVLSIPGLRSGFINRRSVETALDSASGTHARLSGLVNRIGPTPLIVVVPCVPGCGIYLDRVPVNVILDRDSIGELASIVPILTVVSFRDRLAATVETVPLGLPPAVAAAFVHALRSPAPVRSCMKLAKVVGLSGRQLRRKLLMSPQGTAGRTLHWFVDAALAIRACELAAHGWNQLRVAAELGMAERTLASVRTRVLGQGCKWSDLQEDSAFVERHIWMTLAAPMQNTRKESSIRH